MTLSLFIYLCGRKNMQLSDILQLMISGKYIFEFWGKGSIQFIFSSKKWHHINKIQNYSTIIKNMTFIQSEKCNNVAIAFCL